MNTKYILECYRRNLRSQRTVRIHRIPSGNARDFWNYYDVTIENLVTEYIWVSSICISFITFCFDCFASALACTKDIWKLSTKTATNKLLKENTNKS